MIRLLRNRDGSFTLEASLVFPAIFVTLTVMLFFCLFLYQRAILDQAAVVAAERSAYVWDNSHRDPRTGSSPEGQYDSLYWRLSDDGMLKAIFGLSGSSSTAHIQLPSAADGKDSLPVLKLRRVGSAIPAGINGTMEYGNDILLRKVDVSLKRLVPLAPLERIIGDPTQAGRSVAYVVDPVEWIRTVDLARYYGAKFQGKGGSKINKQEAGKALGLFGK